MEIFTPGYGFSMSADEDFNTKYGLAPGSTVMIPAGYYPYIEIGKLQDITFVNEGGQVICDNINMGPNAVSPKLKGTGVSGIYGFQTTGINRFGLGWEFAQGDMEITGWHSTGNVIGVKVATTPGTTGSQNVYIHDCLIDNSINEAIYLGYHIVGGIFIKGKVERVIIRNSGADGIQCRNGYFEVYDCDLDGIGLNGDSNHSQGILFGGNTNGGIAKRNKIKNVAGYGFFVNGFGTFDIECNQVDSLSSGIFTKNYEYDQDLQKVGFQTINFKNNIVNAGNGLAFEHLYHDNEIDVTINAANNKTSGNKSLEPGVNWIGVNNGPDVVPQCTGAKELIRKGYWIIDSHRLYWKAFKDSSSTTGYTLETGNYTWWKN